MPHTKSAKKRHKQSEANRLKNRAMKSSLKTLNRRVRSKAAAKDLAGAETDFRLTSQALDRAAAKGIIHRNAASRTKSRLQKVLKATKQG